MLIKEHFVESDRWKKVFQQRPAVPGSHTLHGEDTFFMTWIFWSLLSALFAGATAILAKLGVANINSNLATAVRTSVIFVLVWGIALADVPASTLMHVSRRHR